MPRLLVDRIIWWMRMQQVRKRLPTHVATIADFGSGTQAPLLQRFLDAKLADHAVGVDITVDPTANSTRLSLVQADLNHPLPLANESIDAAISLAVLEHLDAPDVFLKEAYRVLKPGGTIFLTTPSPRGKPVLELISFRLHLIDPREIEDHRQYFDAAMLRAAFTHAGFADANIVHSTFQLGMNNIVVATK